ncbi:hypothetical protein GcM3_198006 [Golovinomyces cichoracearum]|uniref:Uncharacterized protein n=1 Tax=Golovinomyces cichoracearum TaxID=62708 RepID=A0A420HF50_9PEZI|nr:hypothetical protein GcM3_198006 [Golovinomyces cichoracearum]
MMPLLPGMPPQFLLPSWNLRQLVSNAKKSHCKNNKVPWISIILDADKRNYCFTNTIPIKDPFRLKTSTPLAKFHSRCQILSNKIDASVSSCIRDEVTSDAKVGKEPPLLDRVFLQQGELAGSGASLEGMERTSYLESDEITPSSLPSKQVNTGFLGSPSKSDKDNFESTNSLKATDNEPINVTLNKDDIISRSNSHLELTVDSGGVESIITHKLMNDKLEADLKKTKDQESFPNNIQNSALIIDSTKSFESKSLFDELFPEELAKQNTAVAKRRRAIIRLETLPIFNWKPNIGPRKTTASQKFGLEQKKMEANLSASSKTQSFKTASLSFENLFVLSLNACGTSLEESDFFRLGSKGEHIESWASGIVKVIPVRNEDTLRCIGSYLILFSTEDSARAYLEQIMRLHKLSRMKEKSDKLMLPVKSEDLHKGENVDSLLKSFSLVPGYSRLYLKPLKRPFKTRISNILRNDGPVGKIRLSTKTDNLVLLYLDIGKVSLDDFKSFIKQDGKRRNSHWKLLGGPDMIIEVNDTENLDPQAFTGTSKQKNTQPKPSSFILPFAVESEVRRFIREWHRRPFPLNRKKDKDDHYVPIVNAEVLW